MNENLFTLMWTQQMLLTANLLVKWTMPIGATLIHVSAVCSTAAAMTVMVGISTDTDSVIAAFEAGQSAVPVVKDLGDFSEPHFNAGDILVMTVDFNGDAGTAGTNPCVVLTFLAG